MMEINNKGVSFYVALGLLVLFSAAALTTSSYIVKHSLFMKNNIDRLESTLIAEEKITEAINLIEDNKFVDTTFLTNVELRTGVDLVVTTNDVIEITYPISDTQEVYAYIDTSYLYDDMFSYSSRGATEIEGHITATNMMKNYVFYKLEEEHGPLTLYPNKYDTFSSVVLYTRDLALAGEYFGYVDGTTFSSSFTPVITDNLYVEGDVIINQSDGAVKEIIVPAGKTLVINGNLLVRAKATIDGVVIVNGTVTYEENGNFLLGTIYCSGNFTGSPRLNFPEIDNEPAFIFSDNHVYLDDNTDGSVYILANSFGIYTGENSILSGGIYSRTQTTSYIENIFLQGNSTNLSTNTVMTDWDFEQFGVIAILNRTNEEYLGYDKVLPRVRNK